MVNEGDIRCPCGCGVTVRRKMAAVDQALAQLGKLVDEGQKGVCVLCVDCDPVRENVCCVAYNWRVRGAGYSKAKKSGNWWRCRTHGWSED